MLDKKKTSGVSFRYKKGIIEWDKMNNWKSRF